MFRNDWTYTRSAVWLDTTNSGAATNSFRQILRIQYYN